METKLGGGGTLFNGHDNLSVVPSMHAWCMHGQVRLCLTFQGTSKTTERRPILVKYDDN